MPWQGRASAAKSQRGVELREGTGVRASYGIAADGLRSAETRREWLSCSANWPFLFAPRTRGTGRPRRAVQTGAMAHGKRKRKGAIRPPLRGPTTEFRRCHWRGRARRLAQRPALSGPALSGPALAGQRVFFGPRIELKGSDRETPAKRASEWLHVPPRSIVQALPFADTKRPAFESSPPSPKIAGGPATARRGCCPRALLAPPPVFLVRTRRAGISDCPRHQVAFGPLPLHCHGTRKTEDEDRRQKTANRKQRKQVVGFPPWRPAPWVDDE